MTDFQSEAEKELGRVREWVDNNPDRHIAMAQVWAILHLAEVLGASDG